MDMLLNKTIESLSANTKRIAIVKTKWEPCHKEYLTFAYPTKEFTFFESPELDMETLLAAVKELMYNIEDVCNETCPEVLEIRNL